MEYYQKIRATREDLDLTQTYVAKQLGIKQQQYSDYETGKNEMPIRYLQKLCVVLGVSADYILDLPKGLNWPR